MVKYASVSVQDHAIHVDADWLFEFNSLLESLWPKPDTQAFLRRDIAGLHSMQPNKVSR